MSSSCDAVKLVPTSDSWLELALSDLPTLLVDHAHCEKKAAHTAVRFLFKYPEWPELVSAMSKLAREELIHFDQVLREMKARGISLKPLTSANYAAELFAAARKHGGLGELVACALIEARSHERFVKLAGRVSNPELASFYRDLAAAEERHGEIYLELAAELGAYQKILDELTAREGEIVSRPGQPLRMHAG
jgi:tRNA-(ms[2]io[6]A)-hydroxylase